MANGASVRVMSEIAQAVKKIVEWTKLKCHIQASPERVRYFKEREIWWASIGANIGSEENGKHERFERPILILKRFNENLIWAIPATSKVRENAHHFHSPSGDDSQTFILSQLRAISPKRLLRKQRSLPEDEFMILREKIKMLL